MDIQLIVRKLLEYDPEIVEIVQFGSSVYAPEHARDPDLLIITGSIRERDLRGSSINGSGELRSISRA
jgi:hypothetical protein